MINSNMSSHTYATLAGAEVGWVWLLASQDDNESQTPGSSEPFGDILSLEI